VNVEEVTEYAQTPSNVVVVNSYLYPCPDRGEGTIMKDIIEHKLRVVVASCRPRLHESTFRRVIEKAGVNPYMLDAARKSAHLPERIP